jgi:hypothetical protein
VLADIAIAIAIDAVRCVMSTTIIERRLDR